MDKIIELNRNQLEYSIDTEKIKDLRKSEKSLLITGQPRAQKALLFGTKLRKKGYNIFVTGETGTGRHTAVKNVLKNYKTGVPLKDIACVYNFKNPENPVILYFSQGKAVSFKNNMSSFITSMRTRIRTRLENEGFKKQRNKIIKKYEDIEKDLLDNFEKGLGKDGFQLVNSTTEDNELITDIMPSIDGETVEFDELQALIDEGKISNQEYEEIRSNYYSHLDSLQEVLRKMQHNKIELETNIVELEKKFVEPIIKSEIDYLSSDFPEKEVGKYLKSLKKDILAQIYLFIDDDEENTEVIEAELSRYDVNILVDNSGEKNAPVIFESYPTLSNLLGTIENRIDSNGEMRLSISMVKAGSVIKASGGFLVINAEDLLQEENAWDHLKRALKSSEVQIQQQVNPLIPANIFMKPEAVKIDTKIIIIGSEHLYDILYHSDEEFEKFFKIAAEFDSDMELNDENLGQFIRYIDRYCGRKKIKKVTDSGMSAVIDYGIRLSGSRKKLTTQFSRIVDVLTEADYWAGESHLKEIGAESVAKALEEKKYLNNLQEEKLTNLIKEGTIKIKVDGKETGIINGLAVYEKGSYAFGKPFMISATSAPGDEGIVNIEREAGLSGEIYNKGVMIIEGFLRSRYASRFPLSIYSSICFEQSYGEIEGDSASSTEIYVLLSSITGIPLRQDIAVTGSVNQRGEIQPIGGVTEKIEGFYSICRQISFTGNQGVIIPESNVKNLILNNEIKTAVEKGEFHIYPVKTIDDGIRILTGMEPGEKNKKGAFPSHSFNHLAEKKLKDLSSAGKSSGS